MPKDLGWIRLHRISFNNKLYFSEPFTRWQAWSDLLLIANHTEGWIRIRGVKQDVLRGQIGYSMPILAKRWTWSKGKVIRFLNELRYDHQIVMQKTNVTTLISIVNYNKYQTDEYANEYADSTANRFANDTANEFADSTLTRMIKNDKNDKKEEIKENIPDMGFQPPPPLNAIYPKYTDYNGLPDAYFEMVFKLIKSTKQIEVSKEDVTALWDVFKEQNLTGEKPYKDEKDFYRHFVNWSNKQSFRKKPKPREPSVGKKDSKNVIGLKFINDFTQCEMSDGSVQDLTTNQTDSAKFNQINPKSIKKV